MSTYFIELVKQDDGDLSVFGYIDGDITKISTIKGIDWSKPITGHHKADHQQWVVNLMQMDWQSEIQVDQSKSGSLQDILDQIQKTKQETPAEAYDRAMGVIHNVPKTVKKDPVPIEQKPLTREEIEQRKAYDRAMRSVS